MAYTYQGVGTIQDPFIINSIDDFSAVRDNKTAHYALGADVVGTAGLFEPITGVFSGSLDGRGFTLSDVSIDKGVTANVGIFAELTGTIKNLKLKNIIIKGGSNVGGLIGKSTGGSLLFDIEGSVEVHGSLENIGGLVGYSDSVNVRRVHLDVEIYGGTGTGVGGLIGKVEILRNSLATVLEDIRINGLLEALQANYVGGVIGYYSMAYNGDAQRSFTKLGFDGQIHALSYVGGVIGGMNPTTSLPSSIASIMFSSGIVSGIDYVGGLIGYCNQFSVSYAHTSCKVDGQSNSGGAVGYISRSTFTQVYAGGKVAATVGGFAGTTYVSWSLVQCINNSENGKTQSLAGLTGVTNAQAKISASFIGWDFATIWSMVNGPELYEFPSFPYYGVQGRVLNGSVGVSGATVVLLGANRMHQRTTTGVDGYYKFSALIPERFFSVVAQYYDGETHYSSSSYPNVIPVVLV